MTNFVPGLRGGLQESPDLSRNTGRVKVDDSAGVPGSRRLRPQAGMVETYVRPAALPKNDDADRLLGALSTLNPALLQFGAALKDEQKDKHAVTNKWLSEHTAEEARKEVRDNPNGAIATALRGEKEQELFAAKYAQADVAAWQEEWATGSKDGLNVEDFIRQRRAAKMKEYEGYGQRFTNEYLRLVEPGLSTIRGGQLKHNVEVRETEKSQGASALLAQTLEAGRQAGKKPDEIAASLFGEIKGNKDLAQMDLARQEAELLSILEREAVKGNVDLVKSIVGFKRPNGFTLLESREHGLTATKLVEKADKALREKNNEGFYETASKLKEAADNGSLDHEALDKLIKEKPGIMSEQAALSLKGHDRQVRERLLERQQKLQTDKTLEDAAAANETKNKFDRNLAITNGNLSALPLTTELKANGTSKVLSAKENRDKAIEEYFEASGKTALKNNETPEQTFNREVEVMSRNGFANPAYKDAMSRGIRTINGITAPGDSVPEGFEEGYRLYKQMKAKSPGLLNAHLSNDEQGRWGLIHTLAEKEGMGITKAAAQFNLIQKDPDRLNDLLKGRARQDLDDAVRREFGNDSNLTDVNRSILARATAIAANGVSTKNATKSAIEEFKGKNQRINGWWVDVTGRELPPNFGELAEARIADYSQKHGTREGISTRDIAVVPVSDGTGVWRMVEKKTGRVLSNSEDGTFTIYDLGQMNSAREAAKHKAIMEEQAQRQKDRNVPAGPGKDKRQLPVSRVGEQIEAATKYRDAGLEDYRKRAKEMEGEPSFLTMITGILGDYLKSGDGSEAGVPEAVPQGGGFRDIVSQK